jgi:putative membrane protein
MFKRYMAACLVATALTAAPALAQSTTTGTTPGGTTPGGQPQNGQAANVSTPEFVRNATIGGMFEIQSSQLALKKTQDQDVKQFADRMVKDHTQVNEKLKSLAKNETVPSDLDQSHQQMLQKLQGENGSNFVDTFKQMQVSAHRQAINLFQSYARNGDNDQLKQLAQQTLPTLQQHLQMAEQITVASNDGKNQQTAQNTSGQNAAGNRNYLKDESPGTWRASKVIGVGVYNEQDQKVGNINEVLFDRDGRVEGVVIGVGGFLGIGERNVAVPYKDLQWSMTPVGRTANASNIDAAGTPRATGPTGAGANPAALGTVPTPGSAGVNTAATPARTNADADKRPAAYPDHAILANASKDQLQNAPQFNYGEAPR